jgi:predicted transcriptional regulator
MTIQNNEVRKYAIAALLNAYSDATQSQLKVRLAYFLNISPKMLSNYINARQGETRYSMNTEKLEKVRVFFGLKTIQRVLNAPPKIDEKVLSSLNSNKVYI